MLRSTCVAGCVHRPSPGASGATLHEQAYVESQMAILPFEAGEERLSHLNERGK